MKNLNPSIVRSYQFLAEGLLFFYILVPVFMYYKLSIPFSSYILTLFLELIVFTLMTRFFKTYAPYILMTPIMMVFLYFVVGYPMIASALLSLFLTWRYVKHLTEVNHENEIKVLLFSLFLMTCLSIYAYMPPVIWMGIIQFTIIVFGYLFSHITASANSNESRSFKLFFGSLASFVAVIGLGAVLFNTVRVVLAKIWSSILYLPILTMSQIMKGLQLVGIDLSDQVDNGTVDFNMDKQMDVPPEVAEDHKHVAEVVDQVLKTSYWSVIGIIAIILVIVAIILYRRKVDKEIMMMEDDEHIETSYLDRSKRKTLKEQFAQFFTSKPKHPARKLFLEFEQHMNKIGLGRKYFETIESWFDRLDVSAEQVELYQKARYGQFDLTDEELANFKEKLKTLKEQVKENRNE